MIALPVKVNFLRRPRRAWMAAAALFAAASMACAVQENNTYPIETFTEMHYAQFYRVQEPPVQPAVAEAMIFESTGGPDQVLEVPAVRERPYDSERAAELFRVNCSVCHGPLGDGNGPAAAYLTAQDSFYAETVSNGQPYGAPPNLLQSRERLTPDAMVGIITNGIVVMPRFGSLLTEEEIREIVAFIYDQDTGLTSR